jgi:nicotinamidase-related amidase
MMTAFNRLSNRAIKEFAARRLARELRYDPVDTAVLLVGVQAELLTDADAVAAIGRLLSAARASGVRTYYSPVEWATPEHGIAYPTPSQSGLSALLTATTGVHPRLTPAANDVVLPPTARLSAFAETDLADRFADLGVCRVVLAGARTDIEIDSTARNAVELGLQTTVVADCCTGTTHAAHTATLEITLPRIVHGIVAVDDLLRRLPGITVLTPKERPCQPTAKTA